MASVLNRTTKAFRSSANTPDFPVADWIINPDMSAVTGFGSQYWIITGDVVTLMDQAARDAVDLVASDAQKDTEAERLQVSGFDRAFAEVVLDEVNILRAEAGLGARTLAQLKTALRSKL